MRIKLKISEVFSSIQGEGMFIGCRQLFVRLVGCNLSCDYCDTPSSYAARTAQIETTPGNRDFDIIKSEVEASVLINLINNKILASPHHSVSITGGEPLLQATALAKVLPEIKSKIFLETNGVLPDNLAIVLPYIDIISMDLKPPSAVGKEFWQEHETFLRLADTRNVYVKLVVTKQLTNDEVDKTIDIIKNVNSHIPLILQPVTMKDNSIGIGYKQVLEYQERALQKINDVRVIGQTHKFFGYL